MAAILLKNCQGFQIRDVRITGFDSGIESVNSNFTAKNVSFQDVRVPFKVDGGSADVQGTRIADTSPRPVQETLSRSAVGWCRSPSPAVPVECGTCGSVFPSKRYSVFNAAFYSKDNQEPCLCGASAKLANGLWSVGQEIISFIEGPNTSRAQLDQIQELARKALEEKFSSDSILDEIRRVHPSLATFFFGHFAC